jgi:hypothetical protein
MGFRAHLKVVEKMEYLISPGDFSSLFLHLSAHNQLLYRLAVFKYKVSPEKMPILWDVIVLVIFYPCKRS